jgi:leukotriene-A4 hydrolase
MTLRRRFLPLALILLLLATGCRERQAAVPALARDPHSFARPEEVAVRHLALDLDVDFERQRLRGTAALHIENRAEAATLYLDTRDLDIERVTLGPEHAEAEFTLGEEVAYLGRPLAVTIRPETQLVTVHYASRPQAAAVQWLAPEQTAGKKHPFLFTQSQAILARTWVPTQDTPGVRMTYEATVRVPRELMAVMSAENPAEKSADGVYRFRMSQPIPAYLLALAVGDLEFRELGPRAGVYAEPSIVKAAAWEFADTPQMIEAAEKLYGPYRWERYDILVLPPSFPFGGMENPRLTFATPTVLAGDRSLTALVAHELAHSWSGNLVTNATWNDFWLNEGFTRYFEQRIMESVYGREYAEMLAQLSLQDLKEELAGMPPRDTHLQLDLAGRDADDGMTSVAYDKGFFFLRMVEEAVGRERFDPFLRGYFDQFAFRSMDSQGFVAYLRQHLVRGDKELEAKLRIDEWVFGPGLPPNAPQVVSARFAAVEQQVEAFAKGTPARKLETKDWSTHEWLHFIRNLPSPLSARRMAELDAAFGFTKTGNSEVLFAWLMRAIESDYRAAYPALERFLTSQGRRKFVRPLFARLAETEAGRERAQRIYAKARPAYHSITRQAIDDVLGVKEQAAR